MQTQDVFLRHDHRTDGHILPRIAEMIKEAGFENKEVLRTIPTRELLSVFVLTRSAKEPTSIFTT
jgi:hypothetical protein